MAISILRVPYYKTSLPMLSIDSSDIYLFCFNAVIKNGTFSSVVSAVNVAPIKININMKYLLTSAGNHCERCQDIPDKKDKVLPVQQ